MSAATPDAATVGAEVAVRVAVTATGLIGLTGLTVTGLLHPALALCAAVVAVAAAVATPAQAPAPTRQIGWHTLVALVLILAFPLIATRLLDQQGVALIGALAAGGLAGAALDPPSPRSHLLRLGVGAATLALTAAGGSTPAAVACVASGAAGVLAGLALAQRQAVTALAAPAPPDERTRRSGRARTSWLLGPVAVGLVLALLAAWALARVPHPPSSSQSSGTGSRQPGDSRGDRGDGSSSGTSTRDVDAYLGGDLDLNQRGKLGQEPLFEVPGGVSPVLWRVGVLDVYSGGRWSNDRLLDGIDTSVAIPAGGGPVDLGADDPGGTGFSSAVVGVLGGRGRGVRAGGAPVLSPGVVTGLGAEGPSSVLDDLSVWTAPAAGPVTGYTVRWRERPRVEDGDPDAVPGVPAEVSEDSTATQLPMSVPDRVVELSAQLLGWTQRDDGRVVPAMGPVEAARTLETFLRGNARYSLDAPLPQRGQDPVDAFLFDDRIGFCEHFAAAEVVLLRAGGYPARLATGFAASAATPRADGVLPRVTLTSATAHAWVEVFVPHVGWVSSDPTAGATLVDGQSPRHAVRDWLARHRALVVVLVAVLVAVVACVAAVWLIRRRRRARGPEPARPDVAALGPDGDRLLAAFARLERALAARGSPRAPTETLADLATRLRVLSAVGGPAQAGLDVVPSAGRSAGRSGGRSRARSGSGPGSGSAAVAVAPMPPVDEALEVLERALYRGPTPTPTEVAAAADRLDAAARALTP